MSGQRRRDAVVSVALVVVTFLLFFQTRHHDFLVLDDVQYVTKNDRVLTGLSWSNVRWAFTTLLVANWHPLTWLSHMTDVQLFGPNPGPAHLVNAALHAVNVALVFIVLTSLTGRRGPSAIVAVLFAVHPLRMESVAWIAERKDVLCALFFLGAIGCYGQYVLRRSWAWYVATLLVFALGILAKPMVVTFPFVLLLLDCWPLQRQARWTRLLLEKLPFLLMSIGSSVVTFIAQRRAGAMDLSIYPLKLRIANAIWAYGKYVQKSILPTDLAVFYPYYGIIRGTQFPWAQAAVSAVIILIISALAIAVWRRERAVLIGWLWFCGIMVPTIGLVQVGAQSMADRYTYLPHIGLFIALVWGGAALGDRWSSLRKPMLGLVGGFAAVLAISTAYQLRYWQDSNTLFTHAREVTHHNPVADVSVALWLTQRDRNDEAYPYYLSALELAPAMVEAHNNLGVLLSERGDLAGALSHLLSAVGMNPQYAEAHNNLANVLARQGRYSQAIYQHREAILLNPDLSQAYYNLGLTLMEVGRYEHAADNFQHALKLRPKYTEARLACALALLAAGDAAGGKTQFEHYLESAPDDTRAMAKFAFALATNPNPRGRDPQAAIALSQHLTQMTYFRQPEALDTLGAAYAAAGDFPHAIEAATRAQSLAVASGANVAAARIQARLDLYRQRKAFVSTTQPAQPTTMPRENEKPTTGLSFPSTNPENPPH